MKKGRFLTLLLAGLMSVAAYGKASPTLLSIKETITDNSIVYPESFETDTKEMMKNWYIQNYTVLDSDVENKSSNDVSDQEYIKRLKAMPTLIEMPYNQVVRKYIDMYVQKRRTLVETMLGMSLYYMPIFEQALEKEGMPLELKYLPVIESALNPEAVSRVGATGLWQFMLGTAKGLGLEVNTLVDERRDPYRSSEAAAKYLKRLYNIYNDWSLAIAAYNCGPNNVNKALRRAGGDSKDFWEIYAYLPKETRGYVPAFIAANYVMTYFKYHNISPSLAKKPIVTDTVSVSKRVNLNQISNVLNMPMDELRVLNPQFRHDIIPGDTRAYSLALPSHQIYSYIMSEDSIVNYRTDLYARRDVVEPTVYNNDNGGSEYTYEKRLVTKSHKVRKGENLASIARRYGTTTSAIKKANGLKSGKVQKGRVLKVSVYERVRVRKPVEQTRDEELAENTQEEVVDAEGTDMEVSQEEVDNSPYSGSKRIVDKQTSSKKNSKVREDVSVKRKKYAKEEAKEETVTKKNKNSKADAKVETTSKKNKNSKADAKEETTSKKSKNSKADAKEEVTSKKSKNSKADAKEETTSKKSKKSKEEASKSSKKEKTSSYSVKEGESLYKIAKKNGVTVEELTKANNIKGSTIQPGQKIKIPKKKKK